uniref:NADH-ubiquinone oxidoreductase chain 6 n=1 Tax=Diplonevra peregrina TaxID=1003499 RepID=A0A7U3QRQ0_9MUSC|nr:NADH dehydrogenase subunit 6 [Diplonevra peregrina]QPN53562.1 NADH dehydrogenase subunit 6 [Diplonevra peregrina]
MLQNLLIIFIILFSFIFMQMIHPLSMGLILLLQTLLISLLIGLMNETYWFSYILFLVFLGGMLILFIYVTSTASNETFNLSINQFFFSIMFMIIMLFLLFIYDDMINNLYYTNMMNFNTENSMNLIKLFNYPTNLITILLMNYLLITLIAVVKITNIFYGPLRHMFN